MKRICRYFFAGLALVCCGSAYAANDIPQSGIEVSSLGMVSAAIGVTEKKISGFYHFVQIEMPDRSFNADCKIFFSGKSSLIKAIPVRVVAVNAKEKKIVNGILGFNGYVKFAKNLPAQQSFTLHLTENLPNCTDEIDISNSDFSFQLNKLGNWQAVNVINSKRAYFYKEPLISAKDKVFLVTGDLVYIYDEKPNWYNVKYQGGKKETTGWIKKSDTLQF